MSFANSQGAIRYVLQIDDSNATQKLNQFKNNLRSLDSSASSSAKGFGNLNNAADRFGTGTSKLSQGLTALKSNFGTLTTGIGVTMSTIVNMSRAWRDLEDTQIAVDRTALKITRTEEAQAKAQEKVNELIWRGKEDTPEYAQAMTDLQQATDAATLAVQMHDEALENQADTYQDFYLNIVSSAISSIGVLGTAMQSFGITGTAAIGKISGAIKGLGGSLNMLTTGGIVGLVITGIALFAKGLYDLKVRIDDLKASAADIEQKVVMPVKDFIFGGAIQKADLDTIDAYLVQVEEAIKTKEELLANSDIWGKSSGIITQDLPELRDAQKILKAVKDGFGGIVEVVDLANHSTFRYNGTVRTLNATMGLTTAAQDTFNLVLDNGRDILNKTYQLVKDQIVNGPRYIAIENQKNAALAQAVQVESELSLTIPKANAQLSDQTELNEEAKAAWDAHIGAIRSFSDEILGLDKKGFKDFFKDLGFGKSTIKDILKQQLKQADLKDIFSDIRGGIMSFDQFTFDESQITKWISNLKKRIEKAIKNTPEAKPLAADLIGLTDAKTAEEFKTKFVALLNKISGDPALQTAAAKLGIDTSTDFANGLGQGFAKMDFSKFLKVNKSGGTTATGNPLTPLINTMTKSMDQLVAYLEKSVTGMKLKMPPADLRQLTKSFSNAINSAENTAETILKELQIKMPAVDLRNYTKSLGKAVDSAEAAREEIEKELESDIQIKITFDADDLPEYKVKTTSSGYKLVEAATGYQGWVKGNQKGQMFLVGEGGEDEYVSITPKSKMAQGSTSGGGMGSPIQVVVNINGNEIIESKKIVRLIRDVAGRNTSRHL